MSLYQCTQCGARENTALGHYWSAEEGKALCSECHTGEWHGEFPKIILPLGMFITDRRGNLAHKETGDTDINKYAINKGESMKYVCFENEETGKEEIMLFPDTIHHDCFVESVQGIRNRSYDPWKRIHRTPVSAGFVDANLVCHGESETLNLASRLGDTQILKKQLKLSP